MINFGTIGFVAFLFIGFSVINGVLGGVIVSQNDIEILNQLSVFRTFDVLGIFTLPVPNMSFLTTAIPHLFMWDYSFFGGQASIILYLLYSITGAASFGLFITVIGLAANFFGRRR